ncbi:MAG: hypothetical protein JWP75_3251 [Frondihabitans sp.]|nr:hypothetical protein [Frondihabitans sp.]
MSAPTEDRSTFVDLVAQLRRRWAVVAGGALLGLVVGIALVQALLSPGAAPSTRLVVVLVDTGIGLLVGFVAGFALVSLLPRVTTVDDVRRVVGLPVIAQLPSATLDADDFTDRSTSSRMRTSLREAVLNLRALAGGDLPERVVIARTDMVAEACGVDGGLARALVESGYVPALVQSDFEGRMLVRPATVDDSSFGEVTRQDPAGYQHIAVTDRVASARPRERQARVDTYLHDLSERYDVSVAQVASDSTPLPLRSIAPVADAVLLVVRSNRTTVESLLSLYAELVSLDVKPLGVIMTSVAPRHRILLRRTWSPTDFRSGDLAKRDAEVKLAGFSIADLATRSFSEPVGSFDSLDRIGRIDRKDFS